MLNNKNERELAYLVRVDDITPMNADRLECAHIGGWHCVVGKDEFKVGDLAVYFEIDSKLPEVEPFLSMEFLASKHFKIKSQKIRGEISQGLLMPVSAFHMTLGKDCAFDNDMNYYYLTDDSRFLTKLLNVTYAVAEDNSRKSSGIDKYKRMAQRHPNFAKKWFWRKLWKYNWGKKLLFLCFGKAKDKKNAWPAWVHKTDEERVQNMPWILNDKSAWIATEKIDGSSTTFTMKRHKKKFEFYICSRNVVFDKPDKKCYYETNIYTEMAEKYNIEAVLKRILELHSDWDWVTIQGETYGAGIQKRDYSLSEHNFAAFNFITSKDGRWNSCVARDYLIGYDIPWVPIVDNTFILPDTVEELLDLADGKSVIDNGMREGLVFRSVDGTQSFKAVSNKFLLKYHG